MHCTLQFLNLSKIFKFTIKQNQLLFAGELRNFLCMVQHDRKFFLTETAHVLKQSITKMDDFTAYKALIGFETISQYANNLFRKPWRKEYRCIKVCIAHITHKLF